MRLFREYVREISALNALVDVASGFEITQAVLVQPHPLWHLAWWHYRRYGHRAERYFRDFFDFPFPGPHPPSFWKSTLLWSGADLAPFDVYVDVDYKNLPPGFDRWLTSKAPILVRVQLRPYGEQSEEGQQRDRIVEALQEFEFEKVYEDRPLAVFALAQGDKIIAAGPGTVGGFLRDPTSKTDFGLTCEHVVGNVQNVQDANGNQIGSVAYSSNRTPTMAGSLCRKSQGAKLNRHDQALLKIGASVAPITGSFSVPTSKFGPGQRIIMRGSTSGGPHTYVVGALSLVHKINQSGIDYCFEDLFEVAPLPSAFLSNKLGSYLAQSPQQGDSGSWIGCYGSSPSPDWCGMLIAVDNLSGYAIESAEILTWANTVTASKLSLL